MGARLQPPADDLALLPRPFPSDRMRTYPVSPLLNSPRNDDARCSEPAA